MPKLSYMVQRLEVEPSGQDIEPLNILFRWAETLPAPYGTKQVTSILMQHFVHKLLSTLQQWLDILTDDVAGMDYEGLQEVSTWYFGWKNYLLVENSDKCDSMKIEEVFYLMALMINQRLSD